MTATLPPRRIALVVHPTRDVDRVLDQVRRWASNAGVEVMQADVHGNGHREVAPRGVIADGDLVVAVGGDGTVLAALHAAAPRRIPVLGVACGSLGALTAVTAERLDDALDRLRAGDWTPRSLPALALTAAGTPDGWAFNDFVVVRRGPGQVIAELTVEGELYVRLAGDGLIVATPAGSSAYSMAAGGPILAAGTAAFVCTPLDQHGGCAPPLVVPADARVTVDVKPGFAGFHVEADGRPHPTEARSFEIGLTPDRFTLVTFRPTGRGLEGLRKRGLVLDSPRVLARDERGTGP